MTDSQEPATNPTLLTKLVRDHKVALGLIAAAITAAPDLLSVPIVNRYEVWGAVGLFALMVILCEITESRRILLTALMIGLCAFGAVDYVTRLYGEGDSSATAAGDPKPPTPRPHVAHVSEDPTLSVRAFDKRWLLHHSGQIDRLDERGDVELSFAVEGTAAAMIACANALVVSHQGGKVARIGPFTGKTLVDYPAGTQSGDLACGRGDVFVSKPNKGSVVQLAGRNLAYIDEFPILSHVTSITYGDDAIWALDGNRNEVVGVRLSTKEKLGPYPVAADAQQILFFHHSIWVLHRKQSCLRRLDLMRKMEFGPGVPLGPFPWRMHLRDNTILVADYDEASVTVVDADSGRLKGRPVRLKGGGRLTDADEFGGRLLAVDNALNRVISLGTAARKARRSPVHQRRPGCPRI